MQITRYASLSEQQFRGCLSAFVDSLFGELNSAAMYLRKLEGQARGGAFAYEMSLDRHRYGALTVLDRWSELLVAFGPHLQLSHEGVLIEEGPAHVRAAEEILTRANQVIDAAARYAPEVVEACLLAFHSVATTFAAERTVAEQSAKLGPMLPEDYKQARGIFVRDLAAR
jgi:hypothetical protein